MRTIQQTNRLMGKDLDRIEERRLDAIIVAVTIAVILAAVLALVAFVDSRAPQPGGDARGDGFTLVD